MELTELMSYTSKMLDNVKKTSEKDVIYNDMFKCNNYATLFKNAEKGLSLSLLSNKAKAKILFAVEEVYSENLNDLYGKIYIDIDKELSDSLIKNNIQQVSMDDFENMPFECFRINLKYFNGIDSVLVYKRDNKLYSHFSNVGKEKISIQMRVEGDKIQPQYTYSSLYYHREIENISSSTQDLVMNAFNYVITIILYMINFKNNTEMYVKNMNYDNYIAKHSQKQLEKPKMQKKLQGKKNTISLQFVKNDIHYVNSMPRGKNKKCITPFLVPGFYRKQRVGPRDNFTIKTIWIKPFFKCVYENNLDFIAKAYQVS